MTRAPPRAAAGKSDWREAIPDDRLAHIIKDTTRLLVRSLQQRLARHEVSFGHWALFRVLWQVDGLRQKELSVRAGLTEPTTHVALKAMEARGFVERRRDPSNNKNWYVYLTPRGRELEQRLVPLAVEVNSIATEGLPQADLEVTRRVLLRMCSNLGPDLEPPAPPKA